MIKCKSSVSLRPSSKRKIEKPVSKQHNHQDVSIEIVQNQKPCDENIDILLRVQIFDQIGFNQENSNY